MRMCHLTPAACMENFEGAIFKGAKTHSVGVLISVYRHTAWDQWEPGHQRAIISQQSLLAVGVTRLQEVK